MGCGELRRRFFGGRRSKRFHGKGSPAEEQQSHHQTESLSAQGGWLPVHEL